MNHSSLNRQISLHSQHSSSDADSAAAESLDNAQRRVRGQTLLQRWVTHRDESQLVKELNARDDQAAKETVVLKIRAITDLRKQEIELDCSRRKAEILKDQTSQAAEPGRRATLAASSAMDGYIALNSEFQRYGAGLNCSERDRQRFSALSKQLADLRMNEVASQHGVCVSSPSEPTAEDSEE